LGHHFILNAHNCHPSLCNDDLSGIAVGIEVIRRLPADHRHHYDLVVMPEHFGTIFPLSDPNFSLRHASGGIFIEALGTDGALALQRSFVGHSYIDRALRNVLASDAYGAWRETPFRLVAGNDETCWEAPGIEVPFASLTRYPFKEYHTSNDTPGLMDVNRLEQSTQAILAAIDVLERDCVMSRTCPDGLVCLSNPRYDLYQPYWDPSIPERNSLQKLGPQAERWNWLMNCFPRYLNGSTTCLQIAEKFSLPFKAVRDYIDAWEKKGLLKTGYAPISIQKPLDIPPW
jgi:aminopeptidase-like protein